MAKSFLFDVNLRIYVATDASPVDPGSYEACSEYVQTILTFARLYQCVRHYLPQRFYCMLTQRVL